MSHPSAHAHSDDGSVLMKPPPNPRNRRTWDLDSEAHSTSPPPPPPPPLEHKMNETPQKEDFSPSRTRSFLNLTTSTLFGIYQDNGYEAVTSQPTPGGNGAQTPAERQPPPQLNFPSNAFERKPSNGQTIRRRRSRKSFKPELQKRYTKPATYLPVVGRTVAMFGAGILYGLLISHLHDRQQIAPVKVNLHQEKWSYLATWGGIGVVLAEALPYVDRLWRGDEGDAVEEDAVEEEAENRRRKNGQDWLNVVRSIGAFVGIAFAIRKLPWQSTLQLSLTLALANPAVWYWIDRSATGFVVSTIVAVAGTAVLLLADPALVPAPGPKQVFQEQLGRHAGSGLVNGSLQALQDEDYVLGIFTLESVGVATWIASVLFVSSLCFGNIGRRLVGSARN